MSASISGDAGLAVMIDQLPGAVFRRVLRPALTAAAQPVTRAAKSGAPRVTGGTSKAIGAKTVTYTNTNTVTAIVGVRRGTQFIIKIGKKNHDPANVIHLVHDGTKPHFLSKTDTGEREAYTTKRGRQRTRTVYRRHGHMHPGAKANPFIARAWASTQAAAVQIATGQIAIRVPIEAAKLAASGQSK